MEWSGPFGWGGPDRNKASCRSDDRPATLPANLAGAGNVDTQFNVFEVLRIAEEIEHKGARFYLNAASQFSDPRRRNICYHLASWRAGHERAWARLRSEYSEKTGDFGTFDPDNYIRSNPHVMAGLPWFGAPDQLTGHETGVQIVRDAVRRSESVLIFYHGLKEFARDPAARDTIDTITIEEDRHVQQLAGSLAQIPRASNDFDRRDPIFCKASRSDGRYKRQKETSLS